MAANESLMQGFKLSPLPALSPHTRTLPPVRVRIRTITEKTITENKEKKPTLCRLLHDPAAGRLLPEQDESGSRLLVIASSTIASTG
jgi:hypothetical protein